MGRPRTLRVGLALVFGLTSTLVAALFGTLLLHQARRQLAIAIDEGLVPVATALAERVGAEGPAAIAPHHRRHRHHPRRLRRGRQPARRRGAGLPAPADGLNAFRT